MRKFHSILMACVTMVALSAFGAHSDALPADLVNSCLQRPIGPGQAVHVDKASQVSAGKYPGAAKMSGVFRYYIERDGLRVKADTKYAYFKTRSSGQKPSVELFVRAPGAAKQITRFLVFPEGSRGKARTVSLVASPFSATYARRIGGYSINALIPWTSIEGYSAGWQVLPVQAVISGTTPKGYVQMTLTEHGNPSDERTYAGLIQPTIPRVQVKPGQPMYILNPAQVSEGKYPGDGKLSAVFRYYPEKNGLRTIADVKDALFTTAAPIDAPWLASSMEVHICPPGTHKINEFVFIPEGANGDARIFPLTAANVSAKWKRTPKGYTINAWIPWSAVACYWDGWQVLPVQGTINAMTPNGRLQFTLTQHGNPWNESSFVGLRAR